MATQAPAVVARIPAAPARNSRTPHRPAAGDLGLRGGVDGLGDGQSCLWWSQASAIGCDVCATETAGTNPLTGNPPNSGKIGFRKRYCNSTLQATLPRHAWTLNIDAVEGSDEDSYRFNPWRAPGRVYPSRPCGIAGGEHTYQGPRRRIGGLPIRRSPPRATLGGAAADAGSAAAEKWVAGQ